MEESSVLNGSGIWIFALLILLFGAGGFGFGGNKQGNPASQSDVVYTSAFNQLQDENTAIRSDIQRVGYDNMTTVKDVAYNNLSEIRDLESTVAAGFANQATCCCNVQKEILTNRYEAANNTALINATTVAQTQKILDAIAANRISALEGKVNELQLSNAMSGVPKYSTTIPYPIYDGGTTF